MHKNIAYRPWPIAWSLEAGYGLVGAGLMLILMGWSFPTLLIGSVLLAVGAAVVAGFSLYLSKHENAETPKANDS